ncbi:hypothetical protein DOE73_00205 [Paenibacillus dendritiformis]|nr:hypothetical protein DOE73_00205 [Paenibacillus dendritiformis]
MNCGWSWRSRCRSKRSKRCQWYGVPAPARWRTQDWALSNGRENLCRVGGMPSEAGAGFKRITSGLRNWNADRKFHSADYGG